MSSKAERVRRKLSEWKSVGEVRSKEESRNGEYEDDRFRSVVFGDT